MRGGRMAAAVALGAALAAGPGLAGGIACMLADLGLVLSRTTAAPKEGAIPISEKGQTLRTGAETVVLRMERMEPALVPAGQHVLVPGGKGGPPVWLVVAEGERELAAVKEATGLGDAQLRQVGGIGSCTLYTPCAKCRANFEETVARRTAHPPIFRVRRIDAAAVRAGQLLIHPAPGAGAAVPWVMVFGSDREILAFVNTPGFHRAGDRSAAR